MNAIHIYTMLFCYRRPLKIYNFLYLIIIALFKIFHKYVNYILFYYILPPINYTSNNNFYYKNKY